MAFGSPLIGPEEQNRLINAGLAKANQVLFGDAKATTNDFGNFRSTTYGPGGVGVISGVSQDTKNADADNASKLAIARFNNTKSDLLPAESQANNAETAARAGLIRNQAQTVIPVANASIAQTNAQARLIGTQADVAKHIEFGYGDPNTPTAPAPDHAARESYLLSLQPEAVRPFYRLSDDGTTLVARSPFGR